MKPTPAHGVDPAASLTSVKEAYDQWLRDTLKPQRKCKKRSKRLAALRHLQQPTESSASKHNTDNAQPAHSPRDAAKAAIEQHEASRRRFSALADEANCSHYQYDHGWGPGLQLFARLAHWARLKATGSSDHHRRDHKPSRWEMASFPVRVPPTVLRLCDKEAGVVLFFTTDTSPPHEDAASHKPASKARSPSEEQTLQFHFFPSRQLFLSRVPWILRIVLGGHSNNRPILALSKSTVDCGKSNGLQLLESTEAVEQAISSLWDHSTECLHAVQAYVHTPNTKAWLARPVYRKKDQSSSTVWIITGNDAKVASTQWPRDGSMATPPCQLVRSVHAQSWQEPRTIAATLCQYLDQQVLRPSGVGALSELVTDLVQDGEGYWWLLQVKALQLRSASGMPALGREDSHLRARSAPDRLETVSVLSAATSKAGKRAKWKCGGKYCHYDDTVDVDDDQLNHEPAAYLTKKELLSCEFFDRVESTGDASLRNGSGSLGEALAFYLHHQIHKRERTVLYEPQPLCGVCVQRYYTLRSQITERMQSENGESDAAVVAKPVLKHKRTTKLPASKSLAALPIVYRKSVDNGDEEVGKHAASTPSLLAPSYLDELDRIEQMLNDKTTDTKRTPAAAANAEPREVLPASTPPAEVSKIDQQPPLFSWLAASHDDRIEKMWQSVRLAPLAATSSSASSASAHSSAAPSLAYNTFTLSDAIRESRATPLSTPPTAAVAAPYLISIVDCHRVVADESLREALANQAVDRLLPSSSSSRQPVQFVVLPPEEGDANLHDHLSLGRMALRSLALDVAQLLEQCGARLPTQIPPILEDATNSGALFMTVSHQ